MIKKLLVILAFLGFLCCNNVNAQEISTWRIRHFSADSMRLRLDTCSIVPQSFQIQDLQRSQYRLDPLTATLYLLDSSILGRRLFVQYEAFPTDLSLPVAHKFSREVTMGKYSLIISLSQPCFMAMVI